MKRSSRRLAIPPSRAIVCEILRYGRLVPTFAHDRIFNVAELSMARRQAGPRISWPAIFLKAYAITAPQYPRLRQTWMRFPWPHLYEHPQDVGTLVIHRRFEDDDWLFWAQMNDLAARPLAEIQQQINHYQEQPVGEVFRRQIWFARRAAPLRRLLWWLVFQLSGRKRCKQMGTFFLSTISGKGAEIQHPPSLLTSAFTYGPISEAGRTRVTLIYDHRLMDGHTVADILVTFERTLQNELLDELRGLQRRQATASSSAGGHPAHPR